MLAIRLKKRSLWAYMEDGQREKESVGLRTTITQTKWVEAKETLIVSVVEQ